MLLDPGKGRRLLFRVELAQDQEPKTALQPLGRTAWIAVASGCMVIMIS